MSKRFPGRHVSPWRLSLLIVVIGGLVFAGFQGWQWFANTQTVTAKPWVAGYVDVTATPAYAFENPVTPQGRNVVLSFVVADPDAPCTPSWGGAYGLDEASTVLDLDRRLARLEQRGGEAMVSFGGQANDELATVCTDAAQLLDAYRSVIDRYGIDVIDLDIEGDALDDPASIARRAAAIAALQEERGATTHPVAVWLTLPVATTGLTEKGTDVVTAMLEAGVDLAGVNVMTMNFGADLDDGATLGEASVSALEGVRRQLGVLYGAQGIDLTDATLWNKLGVTPMIGQNDVRDEVFDLDDAEAVNAFVREHRIGRTSMWSLNRDATCGPNVVDLSRVSDSCSGIAQGDSRFAAVLGKDLGGSPLAAAGVETTPEPLPVVTDDPLTSPFPVWAETASYRTGTRVVWHGNVYEAKWWTKGDVPDNPVLQEFETPWRVVGPVLPGETPIPVPTVPAGTYPDWVGDATYERGDRVLFDGLPYEAKWWTRGDSPQISETEPDSSPWLALDAADVLAG
ncbi:chitinase [Streptomyces sp. AC495_CC817]|uniref:chitinase n=1 Tax=Streptomyces sp. AC495_CC817 TaxID=2823900 RepID=UPI001C271A47|nr:carbohydrate-binding protein [Streptomyces sp. AC495_CC817]